jgi:hypothetical protein
LRESLQQQTATADVLKVISRSTFELPLLAWRQPSRPSPFNASSHLAHSVLGLWTKRLYSHCIYFSLGSFIGVQLLD